MAGKPRVLSFLAALVLLAGLTTVVVMMFLDPAQPAIRPAPPAEPDLRPASPAQPPVETRPIGSGPALSPADPVAIKPKALADADLMAVSGFVRDQRDVPVEGALCELFEDASPLRDNMQEGDLHGRQRTEASGAFWFDRNALPPVDHFLIKVRHASYATARKSVDARALGAGGVVIVLRAGTRVSGRVTASGAPLAGATVTVYDLSQGSVDPEGSVETTAAAEASGAWTTANVSPGMKRILASAPGYATGGRLSVLITAGAALENLDVDLRPAGGIGGRVAATDGSPVEGVWVTARCTRIKTPQDASQADADNEKDRRDQGDGAERNDDAQGERQRILDQMRAKGLDPGAQPRPQPPAVPPPPRAPQPALLTLAAKTGPDGRYSIPGAEMGTYVVNLTAPGFVPAGAISVESPTQGADFVVAPGGRILGQVVDAETGQPVPRFKIGLTASPEQTVIPVHTKRAFGPPKFQDGRFELREFSSAARFWLVAEAPGYAGGRSDEIVIAQGERREGIVIRLVRGGTLKGRVLDAKGEPVADASLSLEAAGAAASPGADAIGKLFGRSFKPAASAVRTDSTGRFEIPRVLPGTYVITVRHDRFAPKTTQPLAVGPTGETVVPDVVLTLGASIRGVVRLKGGGPDPEATVQVAPAGPGPAPLDAVRSAKTDAEGRYELGGLPVGQYRVSVIQREGKVDLSVVFKQSGEVVTLAEGEQRELNL